MICILLCTIFPLLTTVATILRLWQTGVLSFPPAGPGCPPDWEVGSGQCLLQLPSPLNWTQADQQCRTVLARLPK